MPVTSTEFIDAARKGNLNVIKKALEESIRIPPAVAQEAFFASAESGQLQVLEFLLSQKSDEKLPINIIAQDKNDNGNTAWMKAAKYGHANIIDAIMIAAFSAKYVVSDLINAQNKHGYTALMYAANQGYADVVKRLLDTYHAAPAIKDKEGNNALYFVSESRPDLKELLKPAVPQEEKSPAPLTLKEVENLLLGYEDAFTMNLPDNPVLVDKQYYDEDSVKQLIGKGMPIPHNQQPFPADFLTTMKVNEEAKKEIERLSKLKTELEQRLQEPSPPSGAAPAVNPEGEVRNVTIHAAPPSPGEEVKEDHVRFSSSPGRASASGYFSPQARRNQQEVKQEVRIENTFESFRDTTVRICRDYLLEREKDLIRGHKMTESGARRRDLAIELLSNLEGRAKGRNDVIEYVNDFLDANLRETKKRGGLHESDKVDPSLLGTLDGLLFDHVKELKKVLPEAKAKAKHQATPGR